MYSKKYIFGDTAIYFTETVIADEKSVGLTVLPKSRKFDETKFMPDPLVQVAFTGDRSLLDYSRGISMKNRESTLLSVEKQTADKEGVETLLTDGKGNYYTHSLCYDKETGVFSVTVLYENKTGKTKTLEFLQSGCISFAPLDGAQKLALYRMTSAWSRECKLKKDGFWELGLEPSWANYGLKSEKWGCIGSMPNRGFYPFAAVEDIDGVIWGMNIEAPFSWQMEVSLERAGVSLAGGHADYEAGHWRKEIKNGERFLTHKAYFTVKEGGGVNAVCNAFVHYQDRRLKVPASEESMPVLYNEYCATWGNPTADKIDAMLDALKEFPIEYFVIDSGWYKPEDKNWCNAIGDWNENKSIFPRGGLKGVAKRINEAGMKAGIWFEYEIAGRDSDVFYNEDMFLKRGGSVLTCKNRRFLDLRKAEVKEYLTKKVLRFLKENGYEYIKIDYNDAYGLGCDGAESLGEAGRQIAEESLQWFDLLQKENGIIIENCSSGGSRIEPYRMNHSSMCSFSDAHECNEIPLVAANVSRVIPARQSQIWAVLRENESDSRTVYSLCAAFMGRVCLSGDVVGLTKEKRELILNGLNFYSEVKDIVRYGDITDIDCDISSYRDPVGRQIYQKEYNGSKLVITHFLGKENVVEIPLKEYRLDGTYTDLDYEEEDGVLRIYGKPFTAGAFLLVKRNG
ncbi:MAG: alpha-galactosidase [Clostridia bacterium]|nr:alpha-galactosidase [Clostridia bacterium]